MPAPFHHALRAVALGLLPFLATLTGLCHWSTAARGPDGPKEVAAGRLDDDDDRQAELAVARRTFVENCLICHSSEMVANQRLTPKQWTAEVEKMIGWGAPVPKEDTPRLIHYLAAQYPTTEAPAQLARLNAAEVSALSRQERLPETSTADPARGGALYATNCATCHGPEARGTDLGLNLVEKPVLLRSADYTRVLREGLRRMPSFRAVLSPEKEADILSWLRERRGKPTPHEREGS